MSLRAIKKRENQFLPPSSVSSASGRTNLFRKLTKTIKGAKQRQQQVGVGNSAAAAEGGSLQTSIKKHNNHSLSNLKQQHKLLGRLTHSNPEFGEPSETLRRLEAARLVRTKSEGDIDKLLSSQNQLKQGVLLNAKSEVCLKTISTHNYQASTASNNNNNNNNNIKRLSQSSVITPSHTQQSNTNMLSGARSHRDLTQSSYASSHHHIDVMSHCPGGGGGVPAQRRMSEGNYRRTQRTNSMSTSEMTSSSISGLGHSVPPVDPNSILRIPIIGYEVMEERARFTVYKLRVENPHTNDCWLVLRRYTDFVRLNTKLKQTFPHLTLNLPRKKIFGDNFNSVFLDNRIQGLQMFVNSIMSKEELRKCQLVREFFCLDEPPTYSESMEECRAIFEAQEETIAHLKMQINNKNDLILQLQQKLRDVHQEKEQLKDMLK
ncbi:sorting nexin 16 isoform X2 [Musca autumnalis]|uniref:sorting nexin 16 isoform X2 n=1 Tax=Musca autumnalis TaxID=221902 RepID=UPI003CF78D3E